VKRLIIPLLLLIALAGSLAWRVQQVQLKAAEMAQSHAAMRERVATVTVARATRRDLQTEIEELATIRAPLNVNVAAKVSGRIDFLRGYEGDRVRAGEVLIRLDPSELEAHVTEMRAALAAARARLSQARGGVDPQAAETRAAIDQAEAEVSTAAAQQVQAEASAESRRATTRHELDQARARLENEQTRLRRSEALLLKGFVATQDVETARTAVAVAQADFDSAEERVKLMAAQVKADLDVARENLKRTQARLRLARANRAQDAMYSDYVASLRAAVSQAKGALANTEAAQAQTVVKSPIDGLVTARLMDPGAMATPGQPILTLVDIRKVWAEVSLSEEQAGDIRRGDLVRVALDAFPGESFAGRVIQINPAANPQSRSFAMRMELDNPALRLKPGMFGRARFIVKRRPDVLVVPREAVLTPQQGEPHVFVVEGDPAGGASLARKTPVQVGTRQGPWAEIRQGLREGQSIITMGHERLKDGAKVKTAPGS
jgi:HlyD family secretion protein